MISHVPSLNHSNSPATSHAIPLVGCRASGNNSDRSSGDRRSNVSDGREAGQAGRRSRATGDAANSGDCGNGRPSDTGSSRDSSSDSGSGGDSSGDGGGSASII